MSETDPIGDGRAKGAQTLMRALDILDEVINGPVRAVDLARKLDTSKTTTHRLAHALKSRDYLTFTRDGFSLGPKLLQLGAMAEEQTDFVRLARPALERLSAETEFCAFVGKREQDWSRHLDRVMGIQRLRVSTAPGDRRPVAETGLGKALLLDESEENWAKLYRQSRTDLVSDVEVAQWVAQMCRFKDDQLVTHTSELGDSVRSVAAPVRNARGQICIAISIASAGYYLTDDKLAELAPKVRRCAEEVSMLAGYKP
jgi:DNA-binding IclR family transcriptional regulator